MDFASAIWYNEKNDCIRFRWNIINKEQEVSETCKKLLFHLKEEGYIIVIATGNFIFCSKNHPKRIFC